MSFININNKIIFYFNIFIVYLKKRYNLYFLYLLLIASSNLTWDFEHTSNCTAYIMSA